MMCMCAHWLAWNTLVRLFAPHPFCSEFRGQKIQHSVHRPSELFEIDFDTILKQRRCSKKQEFLREQRLSNEWNFQWNPCPLWQVHLCALGPSKSFESCRSAVRREVPKKMLRLVQYYQSHQINLLNQHARLVKFCVMATTCNYFIVPSTDPSNSRQFQACSVCQKKTWPRCCMRLLKVCNRLYIMFI